MTRVIGIDADIPLGWTIIEYQHFDEFFYSLPSLNLYHYGTWDSSVLGMSFIDAEDTFSLPYWNIISWGLLNVLDSKIGALRIPAIVAGGGAYFLYIKIILLSEVKSNLKHKELRLHVLAIVFLLYPLVDPVFYYSNVINEPTIHRLMVGMLIMYIFYAYKEISVRLAFWIGFVSVFSVLFVYLYNIFLVIFSLIMIVKKRELKLLYAYFFGGAIVFCLWFMTFELVNSHGVIETLLSLSQPSVIESTISFNFLNSIKGLALLSITNFLAYSPGLAVLVIFSTLGLAFNKSYVLNMVLKKKDTNLGTSEWFLVVMMLYLLSFLVQSLFLNDFPSKKGIIMYFPLLYVVYFVTSKWDNFKIEENISTNMLFLILFLCLSIYLLVILSGSDGGKYFEYHEVLFAKNIYYSYFIICSILVLYSLYIKKALKKISIVIVLSVMIINTTFLNKHLKGHEYSFKRMSGLMSTLSSGYIVGGLSYILSDKNHKPFLYYYTPRYHKIDDPYSSINSLNQKVFSSFVDKGIQFYTAVIGRKNRDAILNKYKHAKVVAEENHYNDVTSYQTLYEKQIPKEMKIKYGNDKRNIFIISLL